MAGDIITHVDDTPIKNFSLSEVLGSFRGPADAQVRLKIVHQGQDSPVDVPIIRKMIRPPGVQLNVRTDAGKLMIESTGPWPVLDFDIAKPIAVRAIPDGEFYVDGGDHTRIAFSVMAPARSQAPSSIPDPERSKGSRSISAVTLTLHAHRRHSRALSRIGYYRRTDLLY